MDPLRQSTAYGCLPENARVPLETILITGELSRRPARLPDHAAENRTMASLLEATARGSSDVLQLLVDSALSLCGAHSAGMSLLQDTDAGPLFRWEAVAGEFAGLRGATLPRASSPCGVVLDQEATVLLSRPERYFNFPPELTPLVVEVLLIPFYVAGRAVGTLWVVSHDELRRFDSEDQRLMASLGRFASTAFQLLKTQATLRSTADENARLYEEASAAHRAKDDFFATLSHELRGPLTSIIGWSAMLARNPTEDTAITAASAISSSALMQVQLVNDLLDISRMVTNKFTITRKAVDLHQIIEDAVTSFRPAAVEKAVFLRFAPSSPSIIIPADARRLQQVIGNLVSNAMRFTPTGGLIEAALHEEGSFAVVTVSDTGDGIPASFLPHVFDRFQQLGAGRHDGMGLGLAIVKHIVELHGGTVTAQSPGENRGCTFTVRLPAA